MVGPAIVPIQDALSYITMYDEPSWATAPGSPTYIHIPSVDYDVKFIPEPHEGDDYTGLLQEKYGRNIAGYPRGTLKSALFGWRPTGLTTSLAQYLMDWAFLTPEAVDLASKAAEWAEGPNLANKRHIGLRCHQAVLSGSEVSKVLSLDLGLMGQDEQGQDVMTTAQTLPDDRHKAIRFEYPDCTFTVNGSEVKLKAFALQGIRKMEVHYLNSTRPYLMPSGRIRYRLSIIPAKDGDTYDAMARATTVQEFAVTLAIKGLHMGTGATGSFATCSIGLPRCSFINAPDQRNRFGVNFQQINLRVPKPDTSANSLALTWGEA